VFHSLFRVFGVRKFPQTLQATGKVAIICNEPGSEGIEHTDHKIDQLVSEFVWIRTCSSTKRFFVRDPSTKERHFAGGEPGSGPARACVGWFDDRFPHCLAAHDEKLQFSIRVDGRFTPEFRERVALTGRFASQLVPTEGGRADVLRAATDGPRFLSEENPNEPNYSDEDEDDEDVDDEDEDDEDDEDEAEDEDGSEEEESALDRASR